MKSDFEVQIYHEILPKITTFIEHNGTIFHQYNFLSAVGEEYSCLLVLHRTTNKIAAALPLVKSKKFILKAHHIPGLTYQFGPVIADEFIQVTGDILRQMLFALGKASHLDLKMFLPNGDLLPYKEHGFTITVGQTHCIRRDSDYTLESIHSSKRRYLKKLLNLLEEQRLIKKEGQACLIDLLSLYKMNAQEVGFNAHEQHLERIFRRLTTDQYYAHVIYTDQGEALAGAFCPYDNKYAYHLINASIKQRDKLLDKANILSTYLAVKKALRIGRGFDFEGSNVPGVAKFYRMMGGQPKFIYRMQKTTSMYYHILRAIKSYKEECF